MCKGCGSYYREGKEEEHLLSRKHCHVMDISYKNGKKRFSMDSRFKRPTNATPERHKSLIVTKPIILELE